MSYSSIDCFGSFIGIVSPDEIKGTITEKIELYALLSVALNRVPDKMREMNFNQRLLPYFLTKSYV